MLTELCSEAELVIVMTDTALRLLVESGTCPEEKVRVVPHGAPARLIARARPTRARTHSSRSPGGLDGFRLSTFGLISAGKGIETVIEALPAVVERYPDLVYTIAGRTHPDVERREGERYRLMLERRAFELGLGTHVVFDDRFLSVDELSACSRQTDVFLTPYASREQIASGALTFALAAGCAVVSTPYWYAQDMLASGAGLLVPFGDSGRRRRRDLQLPRPPGPSSRLHARNPGASARRSRGRPSRKPPLPSWRKPARSRRDDGPQASPSCI